MRHTKWIGLAAALLLVIICFTPWVIIMPRDIVVSGVDATGTRFGRPGYFNLLMTLLFLFFHFIPRIWAKRANLLVCALNLAWSVRNYLVLSACFGGECPVRQIGLYLLLLSSILMLLTALFPDMKLPENKTK